MVTNFITFPAQIYSIYLGKTITASSATLFLSIFKDMIPLSNYSAPSSKHVRQIRKVVAYGEKF